MTSSADVAVAASRGGDADGTVAGEQVDRRHRLRELDRRGRWLAAAFAVALLVAPLVAFGEMAPDWTPANDPALMALRTLDVGTSRTPVSGQPSQSGQYVGDLPTVTHLGPTHFYLMAIPVRALGAATGMLFVSVAITGGCLLLSAWAVFRQLGPPAGILAAVGLAAITFVSGAASLVNPISSNIAGYPMFCSMVLLWCLLCGDLRLLPVTAGVVSFALQQHLSVGPSMAVAVVLVTLLLVRPAWRRWQARDRRRELLRWVGWSAVVGIVLWAPVLLQQLFGDRGNLSTLWDYATHDDRPTLGIDSAVRQVAHVVGLPTLLSQRDLTGFWLMSPPSFVTWASAVAVLAAVVAAGAWLWRTDRRRSGLAVMVGVLVVAGLVNGSSVPEGIEAPRPAFYHWVWPLTFFVLLTLGLAAATLVERSPLRVEVARRRWLAPVAISVALLGMVTAGALGINLNRYSNTLTAMNSPLERRYIEELADEIMAHRDTLGDQTLVLERGQRSFEWLQAALAVELAERGVDARLSHWFARNQFVHADRMADRDTLESGLVLVLGNGVTDLDADVPGELVATADATDFPRNAYERLIAQADAADEVILGDEMEARLAELGDYGPVMRDALQALPDRAEDLLLDDWVVKVLVETGIEQPRLDPDLLQELASSRLDRGYKPYYLEVYLLDREQILEYATTVDLVE